MSLRVVHIELKEANEYVNALHRHHKPVIGHRFSVGALLHGKQVGVAICGRPVARGCDFRTTVEVTRLCTDGTKNVCSFLYSACARASRELGYAHIQTYILASEPGTSLLAAGWILEANVRGRHWSYTGGKERRRDQPECDKTRWGRDL